VALLEQVQAVLDEYGGLLPLSARQVFYRLVGAHGYEKTERAYDRLTEKIGSARRAGIIDFDAIRDDGITVDEPFGFHGKAGFYATVAHHAANYRRNRLDGQAALLEVWCEAAGMVPQLAGAAGPYGVAVYSGSGFDSLTAKHDGARRAADAGSLIVLHVGDHDPSGVHLFSAAYEDVQAWAEHFGGKVEFERVAVTPQQIDTYNLPTAPPKPTDKREFRGQTCQAEALDPITLADIVRTAIEDHIDLDIYRRVLAVESSERDELVVEFERPGEL